MRKRQNRVVICLNDDELNELNEKVIGSGLTRESFLRAMIKGQEIRQLPPMDFYNVLKELRQIDNNMNQIATKAHSLNFIDTAAYRENCTKLESAVGKLIREVF